jgi:spermidine/putrescine transport system permease protein
MPADARRRSPFAWVLAGPMLLWMIALFGLPMLLVIVYGFCAKPETGGISLTAESFRDGKIEFTVENFRNAVWPDDPELRAVRYVIYWRTLWLSAATTVLCLLVSYPTAYFLAIRAAPRWKPILLLLAVLPFWTSFVVRTYAWMYLLDAEGPVTRFCRTLGLVDENTAVMQTDLGLLLGLVYGELPLMILPLYTSLEKMDRRLLEAAADLGATPTAAFLRVTFPLSMPGVFAGCMLVFIPALGAFVTSDMFTRGKTFLVGNLVDFQFSGLPDNPPMAAAFSILMTGVVAILLAVALRAGFSISGERA